MSSPTTQAAPAANLHPLYLHLIETREKLRASGAASVKWLGSPEPAKVAETAEVIADIQAILAQQLGYMLHCRPQLVLPK